MPQVVLVPGDCPEIIPMVLDVVAASGARVQWRHVPRTTIEEIAAEIRKDRVALVGYSRGERHLGKLPPSVQLRQALDTYAQLRPLKSMPGLPSRFSAIDALIVRETTEDVYAHLEHESIPGVFESLKVTTRGACERVGRLAFELARDLGPKRVTIAHKANILKASDGLFLRVAREVAADFPDVASEDVIVDALCMKLVLDPTRFSVLLCGNLYGDIVSDLGCGLVGGASNSPAINVGKDGLRLFTSTHGDGPEHAGTDRVNPLPWLLPAMHLLRHLGDVAASERLDRAIRETLAGQVVPRAAGGDASAAEFCAGVTARLA
jgi:isocitrate dehydrogenase (NAD+)